ncbi:MAG: 23S rRNA (adenine(2503)-C(2))-methyltransferase RlmN [Nitrospira sp.]|nr:23S rRNA (adenine(2503)-C(2))-methyltransferase RlmN [Nitrospira sp.]
MTAPRPTSAASVPSPMNLLSLDLESAQRLVQGLGWPRYRAWQILRWLYRGRLRDIEQMTDLSKAERDRLKAVAVAGRSQDCQVLRSEDGTRKFLISLEDGLVVESVLIPEASRLTLCLSTQVGCTLDCGFCLTGRMGLKRNLKAFEIVDQVLTALDRLEAGETLSNLVLMGMGEPLANFEAVAAAVARLTDDQWGLAFPVRRITLSTAGFASRLNDVAPLGVNLAISLNATTNEQRDQLMPAINRLHPLETLLAACRAYPLPPRRRLTFEYVLLAHVNDSEQDARRLVKLLRGIRCKVNLIPFNEFSPSRRPAPITISSLAPSPTPLPHLGGEDKGEGVRVTSPFKRPEEATVLRFQSVLKRAGIPTFVRKSKGRDILGACGQLGELPQAREQVALTQIGAGC